jgi:hypothetical protein
MVIDPEAAGVYLYQREATGVMEPAPAAACKPDAPVPVAATALYEAGAATVPAVTVTAVAHVVPCEKAVATMQHSAINKRDSFFIRKIVDIMRFTTNL